MEVKHLSGMLIIIIGIARNSKTRSFATTNASCTPTMTLLQAPLKSLLPIPTQTRLLLFVWKRCISVRVRSVTLSYCIQIYIYLYNIYILFTKIDICYSSNAIYKLVILYFVNCVIFTHSIYLKINTTLSFDLFEFKL